MPDSIRPLRGMKDTFKDTRKFNRVIDACTQLLKTIPLIICDTIMVKDLETKEINNLRKSKG